MSRKFLLAALSGLLLTLAFPRWNLWPLAWIALIPLFFSLNQAKNWREGFLFAFLAGFVFFLLSIFWLRHVTVFGLFFLAAIQASYWGVFGVIAHAVIASSRPTGGSRNDGILFLPAAWVALEFIRSEIPVWGFGWNLLGTSQASNLWVAQIASVSGVYGVSFLVFLGNAVVYSLVRTGRSLRLSFLFLLLLAAASLFGFSRFQVFQPSSFLRVSVLQGNIPQLLKWEEVYKEEILKIHLNLTEFVSFDDPQLIVWPEAAFPGFFNQDPEAPRVKDLVRQIQIPVLLGAPHKGENGYYNSVYLITPSKGGEGWGEGQVSVAQRYDKIRLVPFGEYVPWKPILGFLEPYAYALGVSDFSAGREFTVFQSGEKTPPFSTLICFEDTFPGLARKFVDQGADFLLVVTNDAWFGRSSAPYQHLQASIFRAIENGVSVVRAANTGVSGFITPLGEVVERVRNQKGKDTFVMGGVTYPVPARRLATLYRKGGWVFPWICLMILIVKSLRGGAPKRGRSNLTKRLARLLPRPALRAGLLAMTSLFLFTGCIRLQGGAFYAKKKAGEPPEVKEVYLDTDELIKGEKSAPGKIEV